MAVPERPTEIKRVSVINRHRWVEKPEQKQLA